MENLTNKTNAYGTETLKDFARQLMDKFDDGTDLVMEVTMNLLKERLNENDFINFANSL